jgi:hypothetical protein
MSSPTKFVSKRHTAERYGVTPRTIDRWVQAKVFPPSDRQVNTRHYWAEITLNEHDRAQTVAAGSKATKGELKALPVNNASS